MKYLATLTVSCALILTACERPLEPRSDLVRGRTRLASIGLAEHIAWRYCYYDWSYDTVPCVLTVANADGTSAAYGDVVNEPSWSPDATKIAVDDGTDILVVTLADSSFAHLTSNAGNNHSAAWSPDGARIAFVSNRDGQPELYLMNAADGSNVTRVTNGVGFMGNPDWFPDGARLAFDCQVQSGNWDVCAINADGTGFVRVTSDPAADLSPAVSPDGTRIAFATSRFATPAQPSMDIAVMNSDGSNVARLTTNRHAYQPDWSPGGSRISFMVPFAGACDMYCEDSFYTMNADGSSVLYFASGSQAAWRPGDETPPPADDPPVAHLLVQCDDRRLCSFDSYSSTDDHEVVSAIWNMGDGSADVHQSSVSYRYAADGTYNVTLTVFDGSGQSSTDTQSLTVTYTSTDQPPVAGFTATCTDLACAFHDASTDDHYVSIHHWAFGDGSSTYVYLPNHTYGAAGTYQVTLTVTDNVGQTNSVTHAVTVTAPSPPDLPPVARFTSSCVDLACAFQSNTSSDDHTIASRAWTFGDGGSAGNVIAPSHTYVAGGTYQVTLTVTDDAAQANSVTHSVTVTAPPPPDLPPVAQFTASCTGLGCVFQSNASSDDHSIVSRAWTFGDGSSAGSVVAPSRTYGVGGGAFQVTLTVTDDKGQTNSVTHGVTAVDQPPVARFTHSCANTTCAFDGRTSSDDVGITSYTWVFGTQGSGSGAVAAKQFKNKSSQAVTLTVKDGAGRTSSVTQTIVFK